MNRAERRRRQRAGLPVPTPVVTETGQYDQGAMAELPPKRKGRHRWIALVGYVVTEDAVLNEQRTQADGVMRPNYLDHENRFSFHLGCWDCEQQFPEIRAGTRCPADDKESNDG